jgi:hypothetical protein
MDTIPQEVYDTIKGLCVSDRKVLSAYIYTLTDTILYLRQTANNGVECSQCLRQSNEPVCMYCSTCYEEALNG